MLDLKKKKRTNAKIFPIFINLMKYLYILWYNTDYNKLKNWFTVRTIQIVTSDNNVNEDHCPILTDSSNVGNQEQPNFYLVSSIFCYI